MKNLFLIALFWSCSIYSFAQSDWDIFPLHQRTWFQNENNEMALFYNDSIDDQNELALLNF